MAFGREMKKFSAVTNTKIAVVVLDCYQAGEMLNGI